MTRTKAQRYFLPVVHVESVDQAIRNTSLALTNGANGVFLICHRLPHTFLLKVYKQTRSEFPKAWLGINFLDLNPVEALKYLPEDANALWTDNPGLFEGATNVFATETMAQEFKRLRAKSGKKFFYFGGVAFKYQNPLGGQVRLMAETVKASEFVDVVTTSGSETGVPPSSQKIIEMSAYLSHSTPKPIGIASGVDSNNIESFLPYVDYFLVATSISKSFTELDPYKVALLARTIDKWVLKQQALG